MLEKCLAACQIYSSRAMLNTHKFRSTSTTNSNTLRYKTWRCNITLHGTGHVNFTWRVQHSSHMCTRVYHLGHHCSWVSRCALFMHSRSRFISNYIVNVLLVTLYLIGSQKPTWFHCSIIFPVPFVSKSPDNSCLLIFNTVSFCTGGNWS